jgi:hypothetical protein
VVVKPQMDMNAATSSPTTVREHMQTREIVRGQLDMLAATSQPGCSQIRLGLETQESH